METRALQVTSTSSPNKAALGSRPAPSSALRLLTVGVVVFVWWGPHLAKSMSLDTRMRHQLQPFDQACALGTIALLALGCVMAGEALRRLRRAWLTQALDHLFVLALGAGVLANLWYHTRLAPGQRGYQIAQFGTEIRTGWLLLVLVVGYSWGCRSDRLVRGTRRLCLVLLPGVLIVILQMFLQETYSTGGRDPIVAAAPSQESAVDGDLPPIYVMVFDEWSYQRTFQAGEIRPHLTHLRELAQQSVVFHDAHSPNGNSTVFSMAGLLFETDRPVAQQGNTGHTALYFEQHGERVACQAFESFFAYLPPEYHRILVGYSLPYRKWLGDQVDVYRSHPYYGYNRGSHVWTNAAIQTVQAMQWWTDPWSPLVYHKLHRRLEDIQLLDTYSDMEGDVMRIIRARPRRTMVLVHHVLPHLPNITDERGRYLGFDRYRDPADEAAYERNLGYMDEVLGRFIGALKAAGIYDESLLIVTSDHNWRVDPRRRQVDRAPELSHVPLLVKAPGQSAPEHIETRFMNYRLGGLIREVLEASQPLATIRAFVDRGPGAQVLGQARPRE